MSIHHNSINKQEERWLFIRYNQPHSLGIASLKDYQTKLTPLIEINFSSFSFVEVITNSNFNEVLTIFMNFYKDQIAKKAFFPGRYGDWVKFSVFSIDTQQFLSLDCIGHAAWIKATQAADLGIFVKNHKSVFFVGVVRKNEPGKGQPAILGGILDCNKVLDSPAYTIIREAKEESNLTLTYIGDLQELRENYIINQIPVIIENFGIISPELKKITSKINYLTTLRTPEQERNADGTKRVYITHVYCVLIDVQQHELSSEILRKIFQSGDDASDLYIIDITSTIENKKNPDKWVIPPFGLMHHPELFREMVTFLQRNFPSY